MNERDDGVGDGRRELDDQSRFLHGSAGGDGRSGLRIIFYRLRKEGAEHQSASNRFGYPPRSAVVVPSWAGLGWAGLVWSAIG